MSNFIKNACANSVNSVGLQAQWDTPLDRELTKAALDLGYPAFSNGACPEPGRLSA
jgi:hypothetical protein